LELFKIWCGSLTGNILKERYYNGNLSLATEMISNWILKKWGYFWNGYFWNGYFWNGYFWVQ